MPLRNIVDKSRQSISLQKLNEKVKDISSNGGTPLVVSQNEKV